MVALARALGHVGCCALEVKFLALFHRTRRSGSVVLVVVPCPLAWRPLTPPDNQEGGFSRRARAPHPRRRAAPQPRRRRVPGGSPRARSCVRDMAPPSLPSLSSLYLPPTPPKPETTAARAVGDIAEEAHDAHEAPAHTRTPAAQTLPSGSRVAPRGAITGARERRRTRPRARGAWRT